MDVSHIRSEGIFPIHITRSLNHIGSHSFVEVGGHRDGHDVSFVSGIEQGEFLGVGTRSSCLVNCDFEVNVFTGFENDLIDFIHEEWVLFGGVAHRSGDHGVEVTVVDLEGVVFHPAVDRSVTESKLVSRINTKFARWRRSHATRNVSEGGLRQEVTLSSANS